MYMGGISCGGRVPNQELGTRFSEQVQMCCLSMSTQKIRTQITLIREYNIYIIYIYVYILYYYLISTRISKTGFGMLGSARSVRPCAGLQPVRPSA